MGHTFTGITLQNIDYVVVLGGFLGSNTTCGYVDFGSLLRFAPVELMYQSNGSSVQATLIDAVPINVAMHTASLSPDGSLLVLVGGTATSRACNNGTNSVQVLDLATTRWHLLQNAGAVGDVPLGM